MNETCSEIQVKCVSNNNEDNSNHENSEYEEYNQDDKKLCDLRADTVNSTFAKDCVITLFSPPSSLELFI